MVLSRPAASPGPGLAPEEGELQHKSPNGPCQPARAAAAGCEGLAPSRPTSRPTETDVSQITPNIHLPSPTPGHRRISTWAKGVRTCSDSSTLPIPGRKDTDPTMVRILDEHDGGDFADRGPRERQRNRPRGRCSSRGAAATPRSRLAPDARVAQEPRRQFR